MTTNNIDKYKELFEHSKKLLDGEYERFSRIDQKASWHLSALTVLIGISLTLIKWIYDSIIPPANILDYTIIIIFILFYGFLIISWFMFLSALKVHKLQYLPLNESLLDFYVKNKPIDIHYYFSKKCCEAFEFNSKLTNKKSLKLARGYQFTYMTVILLLLFLLTFFLNCFIKHNSINNNNNSIKTTIINKTY